MAVWAARGKPGRSRRRPAGRATPPWAAPPRSLAEASLCPAGDARLYGPWRRRAHLRPLAGWPASRAVSARGAPLAMQRLAMDLGLLSRELSLYLEHQVRIGFFGSGMGLSLILGFSVAYACYYLSSIAKVSRGMERAPRRRATGGFVGSHSTGRSRRRVVGRGGCLGVSMLLPSCCPFPGICWTLLVPARPAPTRLRVGLARSPRTAAGTL